MTLRASLTTLLLAAVLLGGCRSVPRSYDRPRGPYGAALEAATRSGAIYRDFDAELYVYATNETVPFRKARTEYLAKSYNLPPSEVERVTVDLVEKFEGHAIFVAINTADRYSNEIDRPGSPWALTLETPNGLVRPAAIMRVNTTLNTIRGVYPYVDRFFVPFRVLFPSSVGDGPYTLIIAGPKGEVRLPFPAADTTPR